jgi:hypothetical protein
MPFLLVNQLYNISNQLRSKLKNLSANDSGEFICVDRLDVVCEELELEEAIGVVVLTLQRVLHRRELVLVVAVPHAEERADGDLKMIKLGVNVIL